jgi:Family of unknown function (DUF6368)
MAGPVILLRATNFGKSDQVKMLKMLERFAIIEEQRDTYFEFRFKKGKTLGLNLKEISCPFLLDISAKKEALDDLQKVDFDTKIKDNPAAFLNLAAMCKSKDDHYLLAAFMLELHKILGGFINIHGIILPPLLRNAKGEFIHHTHEDQVRYVKAIKGEIHEIRYEIETGGRTSYYHICDAVWLHNWLLHEDFHLIK